MSEKKSVVIDNGSGTCKVGFAGDEAPKMIPSVVGRPRHPGMGGIDPNAVYYGEEALAKRGFLTLKYPIKQGIVSNLDDMEGLWRYIFTSSLKVAPEGQPVVLTESPLNPTENRGKTSEIMFETFNVPSMYLVSRPVAALFASGKTTGVVVQSGEEVTHIVPVFDGRIASGTTRFDVAGKLVIEYMQTKLAEHGYSLTTSAEHEFVRDMKEKFCYVALDFIEEMERYAYDRFKFDKNYELPDGQVITVGSERFGCPELLFQPSLMNMNKTGINSQTYESIMKCEPQIHNQLFENIVLCGGNTLFSGFAYRMKKELTAFTTKVDIIAPPERRYSSWIGASMFASLPNFQELCVSKEEYDEHGLDVIQKKFP